MSDIAASSPVDAPDHLPTLGDLRQRHRELKLLLKERSSEGVLAAASALAEALKVAGTRIVDDRDRDALQGMLEFWAAELVGSGRIDERGWSIAVLDPYRGGDSAGVPAEPMVEAEPEDPAATAIGRATLRISGLARQWRASGEKEGYLLSGRALKEAQGLPAPDRDIADFIAASVFNEAAKQRRFQRLRNIALLVLAATVVALIGLTLFALDSRTEAARARDDAVAERDALRLQTGQTLAALAAAQAARDAAEAARIEVNQRVQELERRQAVLDAVLMVVTSGVAAGAIRLEELTDAVRSEVLPILARDVRAGTLQLAQLPGALADEVRPLVPDAPPSPFNGDLPGYDPFFLGMELPLPIPSSGQLLQGSGIREVKYVNYSLLLNDQRRPALLAAVNHNRPLRRVVTQLPAQFRPDPRSDVQGVEPEPAWFDEPNTIAARLAARGDVSWGGDEVTPEWVAELTDVFANAIPQFYGATSTTWAALEEWVRTQHNPSAEQVTILSGPVLGEPGDHVPLFFWKVAVSPIVSAAGGLKVDAFLVPNEAGEAAGSAFDPAEFRVSIARLEELTGLAFPTAIKAADTVPHDGVSEGARLAAAVSGLDGELQADRTRLAEELITAIRDNGVPTDQQQMIVGALVSMAQDASMRGLTPTGRLNLLIVLAEVPEAFWISGDSLQLLAAARRAVGDLEARAVRGETAIGEQTRVALDRLKGRIGLTELPPQTVYFQFAGMTRDRAETLSTAMKTLGWRIPGEERTTAAVGYNEVRYNPSSEADKAAAEMLAADLVAAGHGAVEPKPNELVRPGIVEIFVSI